MGVRGATLPPQLPIGPSIPHSKVLGLESPSYGERHTPVGSRPRLAQWQLATDH